MPPVLWDSGLSAGSSFGTRAAASLLMRGLRFTQAPSWIEGRATEQSAESPLVHGSGVLNARSFIQGRNGGDSAPTADRKVAEPPRISKMCEAGALGSREVSLGRVQTTGPARVSRSGFGFNHGGIRLPGRNHTGLRPRGKKRRFRKRCRGWPWGRAI